jgi:hypothetical protein
MVTDGGCVVTYQIFPVQAEAIGDILESDGTTVSSTIGQGTESIWFEVLNVDNYFLSIQLTAPPSLENATSVKITSDGSGNFSIQVFLTSVAHGVVLIATYPVSSGAIPVDTYHNVTWAFNCTSSGVKSSAVWLDGASLSPSSISWAGTVAPLPAATYTLEVAYGSSSANSCLANLYINVVAAVATAVGFVSGGLPVNPGSNGQTPTGTQPLLFYSSQGASPSDFLTNLGSGGSAGNLTVVGGGPPAWCGGGSSPVPYPPSAASDATLAELWFGQTPGFVDFTIEGNRRNFISDTGGARDLGIDGSAPFGVTPQVYLTNRSVPSTFALNNGRGGPFIVSGPLLAAGATNPPGSSSSTTNLISGSSGPALLGDYRNGNLYAFNPETLTDNGTPRKWVRRWRALPKSTMAAVKYLSLTITMQTGIGVTPGFQPQIVLKWSDDGGYSWSDPRILAAGATGQTTQVIKFNRLGMTRRFAGSDRIFELSSTDPFMVTINDAEVDAA